MGSLRSALDELRFDDVSSLADDALVRDLEELEHASRLIEAERARRLTEVERRGTYALDGHLSPVAWVADRFGVSRAVASGQVRTARALASMPLPREASSDGEVSTSALAVLVAAREGCPDAFASGESLLLDAARSLPVSMLRTVVDHWRARVDAAGATGEEELRFARRSLHVSHGARCTSRRCWTGWSGSTGTSTPRPGRAC